MHDARLGVFCGDRVKSRLAILSANSSQKENTMRELTLNEINVANGGERHYSVPADPMPSAPSQPPMVPPPWYVIELPDPIEPPLATI